MTYLKDAIRKIIESFREHRAHAHATYAGTEAELEKVRAQAPSNLDAPAETRQILSDPGVGML